MSDPWNGMPPDPAKNGAHWLRHKRKRWATLYEWSELSQCWFAFGVSGTDGAERMAKDMEYIAPVIPPAGEDVIP